MNNKYQTEWTNFDIIALTVILCSVSYFAWRFLA